MSKEEILNEYFLVETEKTKEIKGWKVVGCIENCASYSHSITSLIELKTNGDGWLCDFKIKLLHCGLVLVSSEYVINEDELVMEAIEKIWREWGVSEQLDKILDQQLKENLDKAAKLAPYSPGDYHEGTWTTTTIQPDTTPSWWTNTITCSGTNTYAYNGTTATSYCSA